SIELHQSLELVSARLSQTEFGGEIVGLVRQHFQIAREAGAVADIGKVRRALSRRGQAILLLAELLVLAISHQRIRDLAKCSLDRLLVGKYFFLLLRLRKLDSRAIPAAVEDWLRESPGNAPESCRPAEQAIESGTLKAAGSSQ